MLKSSDDVALFIDFASESEVETPGVSSLGVLGVPWHPQILADQLTLSQPGGADYAHHITTGTPGFSDFPTALDSKGCQKVAMGKCWFDTEHEKLGWTKNITAQKNTWIKLDTGLRITEEKQVDDLKCQNWWTVFKTIFSNYILKGGYPIIFASNVFHNSHLIQKCIQNQQQMRVVKNIRHKDDRMNSLYQIIIF